METDALGYKIYCVRIEEKFLKLHQKLGTLPEKYNIQLSNNAVPCALSVPRKLFIGLREVTKNELKRMGELGVIKGTNTMSMVC